MRVLSGIEEKEALKFIELAVEVAMDASCLRSKCGSVIVSQSEVIGRGFNSPPFDSEAQRKCANSKDSYHKKVTDKTCCVHAEQRAIMDALKNNSSKLGGSRLYFVRINEEGNAKHSGNPYCTVCSKMALDSGVREFVLFQEKGVVVFDTEEYNLLSYEFKA